MLGLSVGGKWDSGVSPAGLPAAQCRVEVFLLGSARLTSSSASLAVWQTDSETQGPSGSYSDTP